MSRNSVTRSVQPINALPPLPAYVAISCNSRSCLGKWNEEDTKKLKKDLQSMLINVTLLRESLQTQFDNTLSPYRSHHSEGHSRTKLVHQQTQQRVPEPILCVPNEHAKSYWDAVYNYIRYPKESDYNELLVPIEESGENIDVPLGKRENAGTFSIKEKIIEGIVGEKMLEVQEDEYVVRERLEECGIVNQNELNRVNASTRRDDEISRELRRLNSQLIGKQKFINECKRKMRDFYDRFKDKDLVFEGLRSAEKSFH
ncbi:hypothetical protein QTN25_005724 [Entamoeba marina]